MDRLETPAAHKKRVGESRNALPDQILCEPRVCLCFQYLLCFLQALHVLLRGRREALRHSFNDIHRVEGLIAPKNESNLGSLHVSYPDHLLRAWARCHAVNLVTV